MHRCAPKKDNPAVVVVPLAVQKPVRPYWYGYGGYSTCRGTNSKSKSLSGSESNTMGLGHEKLDDGTGPDAAMLSRLGGRGYSVAESSAAYRTEPVAVDPDFDPEAEKPQQAAARNALMHVRVPMTLCGKLLVVAIPELLRSLARHEGLDPPAGAEVSKISARQSIVGCVLIKSALRI